MMIVSQAEGAASENAIATADTVASRLRTVAGFVADPPTLHLLPSASEPSFTTVRLSPQTLLTGADGTRLTPNALSQAEVVALAVRFDPDGGAVALAIAVRTFLCTQPQAPAEPAP